MEKVHRATPHHPHERGVDIAKVVAARVELHARRKAANYARYKRRYARISEHL